MQQKTTFFACSSQTPGDCTKNIRRRITISRLLTALKSCSSSKDLSSGRQAHADAVKVGIDSDIYVATNLINMYAKCGSLSDAYRVFQRMTLRNVVSWTALMLGYANSGEDEFVLKLFARMQSEGCSPNHRTFVVVLKSCSNLAAKEELTQLGGDDHLVKVRALEIGMAVHSSFAAGCRSDIFVSNTLIDMYAKCGSLIDSFRSFFEISLPDIVSWNTLMLGCAENGNEISALNLFVDMQAQGCVPNARSVVAALRACTGMAEREEVMEIGGKVMKVQSLEAAMAVHRQAVNSGLDKELFVSNSLVDLYSKCGSLRDAEEVFNGIPQRDLVSWNSLLLGFVNNGEAEQTLKLFCGMSLKPDCRTFITALKACSSLQATGIGKAIHGDICRSGFEEATVITNCLVDAYGKFGRLDDAQRVFDSSPSSANDVVTWNSLIAGYSRRGDADKVLDLFGRMVKEGRKPNEITFTHIFSACSHEGAVIEAKECFEAMQVRYGVAPAVDHYICMIDMLGRASELDSAVEMMKAMPVEARNDPVLWKSLLSACRKWKNLELGKLAFETLIWRLGVKDPAVYDLMFNLV